MLKTLKTLLIFVPGYHHYDTKERCDFADALYLFLPSFVFIHFKKLTYIIVTTINGINTVFYIKMSDK